MITIIDKIITNLGVEIKFQISTVEPEEGEEEEEEEEVSEE
jgi:hypothetical protein